MRPALKAAAIRGPEGEQPAPHGAVTAPPNLGRPASVGSLRAHTSDSRDDGVGKVAGFSPHAGVAARADQRQKLERLCRYISRPAIAEKRLSVTPNGNVRYQLKTPYRDGTTHVI